MNRLSSRVQEGRGGGGAERSGKRKKRGVKKG